MSTLDLTDKAIVNLSNIFIKDTKLTKVLSTPRLTAEDKSAIVARAEQAHRYQRCDCQEFATDSG
jgi:F0F1-type ATP synthase delta subunit